MQMILLVILSTVSVTWAESITNATTQDLIVDYHNNHRAAVDPPSLPGHMATMTWSTAAADAAEAYLNNDCSHHFEHQSPSAYGQNMYVSWLPDIGDALTKSMDSWWGEEQYFNQPENKCAYGQGCGHYRQMAWATTTGVGCAYLKDCPKNSGVGTWEYAIHCFYDPPGNGAGFPYINSSVTLPQTPTIDSMEIIPGSPNNFLKVDFTRGIGIDVSQRNVWRITWSGPNDLWNWWQASWGPPAFLTIPEGADTAEFTLKVGNGGDGETAPSQTISLI